MPLLAIMHITKRWLVRLPKGKTRKKNKPKKKRRKRRKHRVFLLDEYMFLVDLNFLVLFGLIMHREINVKS